MEESNDIVPYELRFSSVYENINGGKIFIHIDYEPKNDHELLYIIAMEKADIGNIVEILPQIHIKEVDKRLKLLPNVKKNKNPDLRINGIYVEVKEPQIPYSKNNIGHIINYASKQADIVIINLIDNVNISFLQKLAKRKFTTHECLKSIEFRLINKYIIFNK